LVFLDVYAQSAIRRDAAKAHFVRIEPSRAPHQKTGSGSEVLDVWVKIS